MEFLSGLKGTIFIDHMPKSMRINEKCQARVISVDSANKRICLSMLPHILAMESCKNSLPSAATIFNNVKV
jgi:predicted RNA-binding protein with RPS1 domain